MGEIEVVKKAREVLFGVDSIEWFYFYPLMHKMLLGRISSERPLYRTFAPPCMLFIAPAKNKASMAK